MRGLVARAATYRFLDTFILIFPFYTVMFAERGLSPAQIGLALAAWSLTGLLLEIPTGVLADRVSRRWILFVAQLFRGAGFLLWAVWPTFWGFLLGLVLWGVKTAMMSGTFEALLFDELKAAGRTHEYARVIGRTQTGRFSGLMAASLLAAVAAPLGHTTLTFISSATAIVAAFSALALPRAPRAIGTRGAGYVRQIRQGIAEAVRRPGVLAIMSFIAIMQALLAACDDYWQIFGREVGLADAQIALFVAALAAAQAGGAWIAHRAPLTRPGALHGLVAVAGLCLLAAALTFRPASAVLAIAFTGLCRIGDVRADAQFQHALSGEARATVASVKGFVAQGATTLLILAFGVVADISAYRTAFLVNGAALTALGAGYLLISQRRARA